MIRKIITMIVLVAVMNACTKDTDIEGDAGIDVQTPEEVLLDEPTFTATMEEMPDSKVTLNNRMPVWEVGDQISVNGYYFTANTAGASTSFSRATVIRPVYVSSTNTQSLNNSNPASNLVDNAGTNTRWCANTDHKVDGAWNIVVSTGRETRLKSILLWNAESGHGSYVNRLWKEIKVYGSASSTSDWEEIKSFDNLDLEANDFGFAGTIAVNSAVAYTFYRIDVINNKGDAWMQMSDMKFEVEIAEWIRPAFISSADKGQYGDNFASNLVDDAGTSTRWCASKEHRVDNAWNIVVSTGSSTTLKAIRLWNAENSSIYPRRVWKTMVLYGSDSPSGDWEEIRYFNELNLEANNYGLAGEISVNAEKSYTFYKIDVLDNEGDTYIQMSDMKFSISLGSGPYRAYFPASLYNGTTTSLPSEVHEVWSDGKFDMPMHAYGTTTDLQFANLCGVLKIIVRNDQMKLVKSIRVSSANKALSGNFWIFGKSAVLTDSNNINNTVTVVYENAVSTTAAGTAFYVAIPAQKYLNLKIELSGNGIDFVKYMTTTNNKSIEVSRNCIYPVTFQATLYPITGTAMRDGNIPVKWMRLWDESPKFAEYNVGASKVADYGELHMLSYGPERILGLYWGSNWRIATRAEYEGLLNNCDSEWVTIEKVNGRLFTGRNEYSSISMFLPAAGIYYENEGHGYGSYGYYASSTMNNEEYVYALWFNEYRQNTQTIWYWGDGCSYRPILKE